MDFVVGDFVTLLIEDGMEEREAIRYFSCYNDCGNWNVARFFKVIRPELRRISKTCRLKHASEIA